MPEGPIEPVAAPIRFHPSLGDDGANVDLVVPEGASEARIRTYERGVEAETLSCGSGAMATTLALHEEGLTGPALTLHTQSGDALEVSLLGPDGQATCRKVRLSGPARRIFDGEYPIRDG